MFAKENHEQNFLWNKADYGKKLALRQDTSVKMAEKKYLNIKLAPQTRSKK